MRPKISTFYPFDYQDILSHAKYAFLYDKCGNQGSDIRPRIVVFEDDNLNKCTGYEIDIYNNGIELHGEFSMPKDSVDVSTLTRDVNTLLCDWLKDQGEYSLVVA